ncbi:MAG: hypothetical protein ABS84_14750 [Rubrivivax sp. SCN 71-131]|nr:MAG: hypothetical protein ABS84_14750 [Rubrivivax sp. SCN 71-131]
MLLAACGGGGGDDDADHPQGPLAKYSGTYTYCDRHERGTMTSTASADGRALTLTLRSDYYQQSGCTGAIVGTETISSPVTATYLSTGTAQVVGWPSASSSATRTVDRVQVTAPATTVSLTGSGVTSVDGQPCVVYTNGRTCLESTANGPLNDVAGIAFTDTALLLLVVAGAGYELDTAFQR